jgi:ATP-dependent Lon protease
MHEGLKANGWALNTEYFVEILHALRTCSVYRSVVDRLIEVEPNAAVRDTEAIKRLATAYLKLLFPHVTEPDKIAPEEFRHYCLEPAMEMRGIIKTQLGIIDPGEFGGKTIPAVRLRAEV